MTTEDVWSATCVVCAARGRQTRLKWGHVCAGCTDRLTADIRAISTLACMAAASMAPKSGTGAGHSVPSSRPPLNVDSLDPELTPIGPPPSPHVLDICESWERLIREERGMAPYGVATSHRAAVAARSNGDAPWTTQATLVGCTGFLAGQVEWAVAEPGFPVEDFADEIARCVRVLRRWDVEAEDRGTMVQCPTIHEDEGECGYRLYYTDVHEEVTCRRCGATRSAMTLAAVAAADGRDVWLDPEAAATWLGVSEGTLRQWARKGIIERSHGRYLVKAERMGA